MNFVNLCETEVVIIGGWLKKSKKKSICMQYLVIEWTLSYVILGD